MKSKYLLSGIVAFAVMFIVSSCAQTLSFQNSSVVPAAQGKVKVKEDDNNNYNIKVDIKDLADINQLDSGKQTYVVWMETRQGTTENIGQLRSERSFFTGQRKASLETVSSFEPFRVFVTAEHGTNVRFPSNQIVLSTETLRR